MNCINCGAGFNVFIGTCRDGGVGQILTCVNEVCESIVVLV